MGMLSEGSIKTELIVIEFGQQTCHGLLRVLAQQHEAPRTTLDGAAVLAALQGQRRLVELAPERDPTYVSTMNANRIVRECLTGIAMRKKGITEKHYLSPLTVDDGRR